MDTNIILISYIIWNAASFITTWADKNRAQKRKWRIRERTFFFWALFFGAAGILIGMQTFRHKTQHLSFVIGIPLLVFCNIAFIYLIWK